MADGQQNSDEMVFTLMPQAGISRDGTLLGDKFCSDGQWVRFQRGDAKKMGGYREFTEDLAGPVRKLLVWTRGNMNSVVSFSSSKIENLLVDNNFTGNDILDRTPSADFTPATNNLWTVDTQYDDAVGTTGTIILAHCNQSLANIDDGTATKPYWALASSTSTLFAAITDAPAVSGGVFSIAPYTIAYGSDGYVAWSDVNQPQVWAGSAVPGDAGADRVTGAKIVAGLPLRAGQLAGLLWSLDSVIRMDYVGGAAIWRFSVVSTQSSILAQNSVIEYDGAYFWIGVDRFLYFDSGVKELPNDMNHNWFFDNLNYSHRQKIWATKVPRFGEIWWFYPRGEATECSHAVIFNVRLKTWYDVELARSAGYYSQVRSYPVWVGSDTAGQHRRLVASGTATGGSTTHLIDAGQSFVSLGVAIGDTVELDSGELGLTVSNVTATDLTCTASAATYSGKAYRITRDIPAGTTYDAYQHEIGYNAVSGDNEIAIPSHFTTPSFGFPTGGISDAQQGMSRWTRLTRVEPDFIQTGDMTMSVLGYEFAQSPADPEATYTFSPDTGKIDLREQRRHILLKFSSNVVDGFYEAGRVIIHTEPGDNRS